MFRRVKDKIFPRRKSAYAANADSTDDHNLSDFGTSDNESVGSCCDSEDDEDVPNVEGPTMITVDDGRGGIKHVRVSKPPDAQSEKSFSGESAVGNHVKQSKDQERQQQKQEVVERRGASSPPSSVADMIKKEFKGQRHLLQIDSQAEKLRRRIVSKKGVVHIGMRHLDRKEKRRMMRDFFNTMLDSQWRYVLLVFSLSFFLSWLGFAVVWFAIAHFHGDFEPGSLPGEQERTGWTPCVLAIHNFASCFLFSIETQHTIGYGSRQTTEECPVAIFIMSFQSVVGVMIQACMVGTIFAKLSRPKRRAETLVFSRNAVVCLRDGRLCLCVRMANMRSSHLVECHVRAILISKKVTEEGEVIPYHQTELTVGTDLDGEEDSVFFIWPMTIVHVINEESPFYNMAARDFLKKRYELIVTLEGIVEPTGMSIQARTSYLPNEILWGCRFVNVLNYKPREGVYKVDYRSFNTVLNAEDTPACSARCLRDQQQQAHQHHQMTSAKSSPLLSSPSSSSASDLRSQRKCSSNLAASSSCHHHHHHHPHENSTLRQAIASTPPAVQRLKAQENQVTAPPRMLPEIRVVGGRSEEEGEGAGKKPKM